MASTRLSSVLPPLIFGTATFNYQFNPDPYALGPTELVQRALKSGVRAFDTSPYYGPAESILGYALDTDLVKESYPRDQYFLLTKVGRVAADIFDYSPEWIRHSVARSCSRLHTQYLDVVYLHDVEFVSAAEVLTAIRTLRTIRNESGTVKYVGICGYPVDVLCELAEMVYHETGEPLDIVQSYANFTIQNTQLLSKGLARLIEAGVDVVPNASPLGMGLLRKQGPPVGAMGNWHPAPDELRAACAAVSKWAELKGEKLEVIAVRFALETWLKEGAKRGTYGSPGNMNGSASVKRQKLGVSVMGVSKTEELDETMRVWRSIFEGVDHDDHESEMTASSGNIPDHVHRRQEIREYAQQIREMLGNWADYAWSSPEPGFVNNKNGPPALEVLASRSEEDRQEDAAMLTPPPERDNEAVLCETSTV